LPPSLPRPPNPPLPSLPHPMLPPLPSLPFTCSNPCIGQTCADYEWDVSCSVLDILNCDCIGCCFENLPPGSPSLPSIQPVQQHPSSDQQYAALSASSAFGFAVLAFLSTYLLLSASGTIRLVRRTFAGECVSTSAGGAVSAGPPGVGGERGPIQRAWKGVGGRRMLAMANPTA
jgi:hypothetical protein